MHSSSCVFICIQNIYSIQFFYIFWHIKRTLAKISPVSLLHLFKITYPYSIKVIGISSVLISFLYMLWKQWQPADMVKLSDFSPFWLCVPAFQQVCLEIFFSKIKYHVVFHTSIIFWWKSVYTYSLFRFGECMFAQ